MKKTITTVAIILALGFVGFKTATAKSVWGYGPGGCGGYGQGNGFALDKKAVEARENFLEETTELRKNIAIKKAELYALYKQEDVDTAQSDEVRRELSDLQNELQDIGIEKGVTIGAPEYCDGPGGYRSGTNRS